MGLSFVFGVPTGGRYGGVYIPGDRLKKLQLLEFTSTAVLMLLSYYNAYHTYASTTLEVTVAPQ